MSNKYAVKIGVVFAPRSEDVVKVKSPNGNPGAKEVIDWIRNNEEYISCCDALVIRVTGDYRPGDKYTHEGSLWIKDTANVVGNIEYDDHRDFDLIKQWFDSRYYIEPYSTFVPDENYTITESGRCKSRR